MKGIPSLPQWAITLAAPEDLHRAATAYESNTLQITWPEPPALKDWAKKQGWPTPLLNFKASFVKSMLESESNFASALAESGISVSFPVHSHEVSEEALQHWDALYNEREDMGALGSRPTRWGELVGSLREVRRSIEAGVDISIGGKSMSRPGSFLSWVHARYPLLEDGHDAWVGDDES